jgi:hypothetical protein
LPEHGSVKLRRHLEARLRLSTIALAAAAALFVVIPANASAAPGGAAMFVHSAQSGELQGGRLMLRGVGRQVTWVLNGGSSGVVSIARLHRRLFAPGTAPATGALHIAGQRGGSEATFGLSRPRYDAARGAVSYRAKRLDKRRAASAAGFRLPRRFGAASLSIVGSPRRLGTTGGGHVCSTVVTNDSGVALINPQASAWDTDDWTQGPPGSGDAIAQGGGTATWETEGGIFRGCGDQVVWSVADGSGTVTFSTVYQWSGAFSNVCHSTSPNVQCVDVGDNGNAPGNPNWDIASG